MFLMNGCQSIPSPKKWAESHIGYTLDELLAPASVKQKAKQNINQEGKKVIVIPSYRTCSIYYTLNRNEIVESYQLVGEDCR